MRATMKTQANTTLYNLNNNYARLANIQQQLGTGSRLTRLADDPLSANIGIQMDTLIARAMQYNRSITTGMTFLDLSGSVLSSVKTSVDRAYYLANQGATDTTGSSQRQTMATEIQSILQSIVNAANTYDGSRFIFGGTSTLKSPYEIIGNRYVRYTGNSENINIQTDANSYTAVNVTGDSAFGRLQGIVSSRDYNPGVNLQPGSSTPLSDLHLGAGVAKGSIKVFYGGYPSGVEIDLSGCSTLEDVKDFIERETLRLSQSLKPGDAGFDPDLADRYLSVTLNPEGNGLMVREADKGLGYTGPDGVRVAGSAAGMTGNAIRIENVGLNTVAAALGIQGDSQAGRIVGADLNPRLSAKTLLTDLQGYDDGTYTITNGALPGAVTILEKTGDINAIFNRWNISGLSKGHNTDLNGELYAKVRVAPGSSLVAQEQDSRLIAPGQSLAALGDTYRGQDVYLHVDRQANGDLRVRLYADESHNTLLREGTIAAPANGASETVTFVPPHETESLSINASLVDAAVGSSKGVRLSVSDDGAGRLAANDPFTDVSLFGLTEANTGPGGQLWFRAERGANGETVVKVYNDQNYADGSLVAQGTMGNDGSVDIHEVDKSGVNGSLRLDPGAMQAAGDTVAARFNAGLEGEDEIFLELYSKPLGQALGAHLVATASSPVNGTFHLQEANGSGISGTVGLNLSSLSRHGETAEITLEARFDATYRDVIHVPAFRERNVGEPGADTGHLASGWQISGLAKAVPGYSKSDYAEYYRRHATAGPDGELDIDLRATYDNAVPPRQDGWEMVVTRPSFSYTIAEGYPPVERVVTVEAETIATGRMKFEPRLDGQGGVVGYNPVNQGRMELVGVPGHEDISGSVHLEMPAATSSGDAPGPLAAPMATTRDIPLSPPGYTVEAGTTLTVPRGTALAPGSVLAAGTVLPKGTVLAAGTVIPAGQALPDGTISTGAPLRRDMTLGKDLALSRDLTLSRVTTLPAETALAEGTLIAAAKAVPAGYAETVPAAHILYAGATLAAGTVLSAGTVIDGHSAGFNALPPGTTLGAFNVLPRGTTIPAGTVFPRGATVPPDGHVALADETLAEPVTLEERFTLGGSMTLPADAGLAIPPDRVLTLANDTALGADVVLAADHAFNAPATLAGGSGYATSLPAGTVFSKGATPPAHVGLTDGGTAMRFDLEATFATVEDLMNKVNASSTYVTARLASDGRGMAFVSQLAGAHLVVSESQEAVQQMGDSHEQLSHVNLTGMVAGMNTDLEGNLHAEVVYYDEDVEIRRPGQDVEVIKAGYYVRFYSDRYQTGLDYADRDAGTLVASAYVPKDEYVPGMTVGIDAANQSNLGGSLRLDYAFVERDADGAVAAQSDDRSITLYPGGLRPSGSGHATVSQMDINGIYAGKNCDFDNKLHATVTYDASAAPAQTRIELYADSSRQRLVASGVVGPNGFVTLQEENGSRLSGTMVVDARLADPGTAGGVSVEQFTISTGGMRNTGHVREENLFASLNDVMDALNANDAEALHDLLGQLKLDLARLNAATADVGSRVQRLEATVNRHEQEIIGYTDIQADRIGTRYTDAIVEFQMAQNIYDASLKVAGQFMQMSLLDYL